MSLIPPNYLLFLITCLIFVSDLWGQDTAETGIKFTCDSVLKNYFKDATWFKFYEFVGSFAVLSIDQNAELKEEFDDKADTLDFKISVKEIKVQYILNLQGDSLNLVELDKSTFLTLRFDDDFILLNPEELDNIPDCLYEAEFNWLISFNQLKLYLRKYRYPNWGSGWNYRLTVNAARTKLFWEVHTQFIRESDKQPILYTMWLNALNGLFEGVSEVVLRPQ